MRAIMIILKKQIKKYQIFCDMDGVLVDLLEGVNQEIYSEPPADSSDRYKKAQIQAREALDGKKMQEKDADPNRPEDFKKPVRQFMYRVMGDNRRFWMNLPWRSEGKVLWDFIKKYDPKILSRPVDLQSVIGKKKWVKDNLGLSGTNVQIRKNKTNYATHEGKIGILIDDFTSNTVPFAEADGISILYKNTQQTIDELKALGF